MKQDLICNSSKIQLKSKQRSISISQIRDLKLSKFLATDHIHNPDKTHHHTESTPKTHRKLSKESISPNYRKKVKTIIHKSSPMNFDTNPATSGNLETLDKKSFNMTNGLSITVRKNFLKPDKQHTDHMTNTISRSHFLAKLKPDTAVPVLDSNTGPILEKIKEKFLLFKQTHFSILNEFNV